MAFKRVGKIKDFTSYNQSTIDFIKSLQLLKIDGMYHESFQNGYVEFLDNLINYSTNKDITQVDLNVLLYSENGKNMVNFLDDLKKLLDKHEIKVAKQKKDLKLFSK